MIAGIENSCRKIDHLQRVWPWLAVVSLWVAAFSLACRLSASTPFAHHSSAGSPGTHRVLTASQAAIGSWLFEKADQYFHKGVPHRTQEEKNMSIFQQLGDITKPETHIHLKQYEIGEMMPWLQLAVQINPHDISSCLVASFWLSNKCNRPDLAHDLLERAQWNNPFCYSIQLERARIYMRERKLHQARRCLDAGLAFLEYRHPNPDEDVLMDKGALLLYRALIYEHNGRKQKAIKLLEKILEIFPGRTHLKDRIKDLETGTEPSVLPSALWSDTLMEEIRDRQKCKREHCHDHGHAH